MDTTEQRIERLVGLVQTAGSALDAQKARAEAALKRQAQISDDMEAAMRSRGLKTLTGFAVVAAILSVTGVLIYWQAEKAGQDIVAAIDRSNSALAGKLSAIEVDAAPPETFAAVPGPQAQVAFQDTQLAILAEIKALRAQKPKVVYLDRPRKKAKAKKKARRGRR